MLTIYLRGKNPGILLHAKLCFMMPVFLVRASHIRTLPFKLACPWSGPTGPVCLGGMSSPMAVEGNYSEPSQCPVSVRLTGIMTNSNY